LSCGGQVGTGSRSEKIKTYNFKDTRVSDHRTKINFDLNKVLDGDLESSVQAMINLDQQEQLEAIAEAA
jgi:peptide chain release factor 1